MRHAAFPWFVLALALTLVVGPGLVPQTILPVDAADATLVFATYRTIITHHTERQDPIKLLAGALRGLRQALAKAGIAERLADLTAADAATAESEFQARFDRAATLGQGKLTVTQLEYAAAAAMAASVGDDDVTAFYTPEQWVQDVLGSFTGVAVVLRHWFGHWVVFRITAYTPAESAGLRPFDRIVAIDGRSVEGMTRDDIGHLIGVGENSDRPAGTTVKLTVKRPGRSLPLTLSIVLQLINRRVPEQHSILAGNVGYIWIRSFRLVTDAAQFRRSLVDLQRSGMRGLVLDLRAYSGDNANAYVNGFLAANAVLPSGLRVQTVASHVEDLRARPEACPTALHNPRGDGSGLIFISRLPSPCIYTTWGGTLLDPSVPLVVIVNGSTGGASEALGAAIRDVRRGKLLGEPTSGSARWADYVALPVGARIGVNTHIVARGNAAVLDKVGIQPDVPVALTAADLDRGVDTQLQRAVELLSR